MARDLAILYSFLPHVDTSALVAARRIRERGVVVDVITQDLGSMLATDPASLAISDGFVDRVATMTAPATWVQWPHITEFCDQATAAIAELEAEQGPYRSVYSRSMWPTSHVMAALHVIRHPGVPWLAEFSDPMLFNVHGEHRKAKVHDDALLAELRAGLEAVGVQPPRSRRLYEWVEILAYALADTILFTNTNQRDYMLGYCADQQLAASVRERSTVQAHPTLPAEFYRMADSDYVLDPDLVHVAYFGVFYATRGLTEVAEALRTLPAEVRTKLRLHVFTDKPDTVTADMREHGLDDVVLARPYVGYLEFLNLTTRFDTLLVNDANTAGGHGVNPYLPSKWSDYAGSGRPVWAIVEEGSVLSRTDTTYRSMLGDAAGAAAVLRRIVEDTEGQITRRRYASA
jgi:glycosyltransferase involved in cell wall biosynthesis